MPRRNEGPRLRWLDKRQCFYITWTERGRSRERSTGTADREQAEIRFAEWLQTRKRTAGPSDPNDGNVADAARDADLGSGWLFSHVRKDVARRLWAPSPRLSESGGREHWKSPETGLKFVRGMSA